MSVVDGTTPARADDDRNIGGAMNLRRRRPVRIAPADAIVRFGSNGSIYMQAASPLGPCAGRITDRLEYWAANEPNRIFLAERPRGRQTREDPQGWRTVTYGEALDAVRRIAQALVDRGLSPDRGVAILSGNSVDHALMALACMYAGILYAPISPAYSLQTREYRALRHVFDLLRPSLVFVADSGPFEAALDSVLAPGIELVVSTTGAIPATPFAELLDTPPKAALETAHHGVGPDSIAKILFTSGSTGRPKGVINTQRMLCANQEMIRSVLRCLQDEPPVLCDWLPWNHTAGGNHNFGLVLYNGGTLYLDDGRPTPEEIAATVRNLREVAVTAHFGVPRSYEMLLPFLRTDPVLRRTFFSRLSLLFYAAAGLSQRFFDELSAMALETCGEEILWMTGFGSTETAPFALSTGSSGAFAGLLGLPAPGLELKIAPVGTKMELRGRGPSITPGYWRQDDLTAAAFDEEGFYRLGDAVRFVDAADPRSGLLFDGRLDEDFKLSSGTWVSVGPLRARLIAAAGGCAFDAVIAAPDRDCLCALMFPNIRACRALASDLATDAPARLVMRHPAVRERFQAAIDRIAQESTGSSTLIVRAAIVEDPPSLDAGEITDKGSINQKAVLAHRSALVDALYAASPLDGRVIAARRQASARV
jgi:feruloyl-CoA synthase